MNELKPIYRRLLNRYHPDRTQDPRQKSAYTSVTIAILDAFERQDLETLLQIEQQGLAYRPEPRLEETITVESVPFTPPSWSGEGVTEKPLGYILGEIFCWLAFPFQLAFGIGNWAENGRLLNAVSLVGAVMWLWIFLRINGGISLLDTWFRSAGYAHESAAGLATVLLHGLVYLGMLPIIVPLGIVTIRAGIVLFGAWILNFIVSHIFGIIHPWLAHVPPVVIVVGLLLHFWDALEDADC